MHVNRLRFGIGDVVSLTVAVVAVFSAWFATRAAANGALERVAAVERAIDGQRAAAMAVARLEDRQGDHSQALEQLRSATSDLAKAMTSQALDAVQLRAKLEDVQRQIDRLERGRA